MYKTKTTQVFAAIKDYLSKLDPQRGPKKRHPPNTYSWAQKKPKGTQKDPGGVQNSIKINVCRVSFFGTPADTFSWRQKQPKGTPKTTRGPAETPEAPPEPRGAPEGPGRSQVIKACREPVGEKSRQNKPRLTNSSREISSYDEKSRGEKKLAERKKRCHFTCSFRTFILARFLVVTLWFVVWFRGSWFRHLVSAKGKGVGGKGGG